MTARVVRLTRYGEKGPGEALKEALLVAGLGLEGNSHQGGERQICLLSLEARRFMEAQPEKGLCFARFKENLLIQGLPFDQLQAGSRLVVGDAVLRISAQGKRCFQACALFSRGIACGLSGGALFAVVEHGGVARVGDPVSM